MAMLFKVCKLTLLVIFCAAGAIAAQPAVSGKVVNSETGRPLSGVKVYNPKSGKSVFTDGNGEFKLSNLSAGEYKLYFLRYEFRTVQRKVTVSGSDVANIVIEMAPFEVKLDEITVTEKSDRNFGIQRLREVEGTSIYAGKKNEVVDIDDLVANITTNKARQIYAQVPGLNIYESTGGGLQLNIGGRGLDPNRSANFNTRQNGYDISADVLGYPESYYTPPAVALKKIQLVRGAASLQYGTQFGGLVNFIMKEPVDSTSFQFRSRNSTGSNKLLGTYNSISGASGNFSYYTYLNYKQGNGFRPNAEFDALNYYAHLGYQIAPSTRVAFEYTYYDYLAQQPGGLTDAMFYRDPFISNRERNWFKVNWNLYALKFNHAFSNKTKLSMNVFGLDASRKSVGFRSNRVSQVDNPDEPRDLILGNFNNWGSEIRLLHRYSIQDQRAVALIGAKYYRSRNTSVQGPGTADSGPDFELADERFPNYRNQSDFVFPNRNIALFGEHIFYFGDRFTITPGMRFEYIKTESMGTYKRINFDLAGNPIRNQTFADNRTFERRLLLFGLGSSYYFENGAELYANISQNYRSVTFNDIRVINPAFQVDPNITDERGYTADVGLRGKYKQLFSYDLGAYMLLYDDRIGEVLKEEERINADGELEETGRLVRFRGNIGKAAIYGIESVIDWNVTNTFFGVAESAGTPWQVNLFLNTAVTRSEYLESSIAGVEGNEVESVPALNLKTGIKATYDGVKASLQYTFLSEQYTDANNVEQNPGDNQSGIKGTIPSYSVLDLSLSYTYDWLKVEAGINNLLNRYYFTRRATGYPGPGIIPSAPRTWYLSFQLTF